MSEETEILVRLGLSTREAKVYLTLLESGESSAFQVAKSSGVPRASVYNILADLERRELVSSWRKNRVLYFEAYHPSALLRRIGEQFASAQQLIPLLTAITEGPRTKPAVKFFTGIRGVKRALDAMYDSAEQRKVREFHTVSHPELGQRFPKYLFALIQRRQRLGIRTHLIAAGVDPLKPPPHYRNDELRETRFLPKNFPIYCTMIVSDVEVVLISLHEKEIHAVQIYSRTISDMFRQMFLFVWHMLPPGK